MKRSKVKSKSINSNKYSKKESGKLIPLYQDILFGEVDRQAIQNILG